MTTIELTPLDLCIAATMVAAPALATGLLQLGLARKLAIASLRTVLQLSALALVLQWVFDLRQVGLICAVLASMVLNAGIAATQRTSRRFRGIGTIATVAVSASSVTTTMIVSQAVLGVTPWYEPRYLIPLLGIVLGNTLTGISLALDGVTAALDEQRELIEARLGLGASAWEACRPHVRDAVRVGMIPILNSMSVVGIVSLPGMMTGQLMAGSSPEQAVQYQIVIMFMVAASTAIGSTIAAWLAFRRLVTRDHQLADRQLRRVDDGS